MSSHDSIRRFSAFILVSLFVVMFSLTAYGNAAEPPGLTVIVSSPPEDLTLSIRFADGSSTDAVELQKEKKAWETYYRFFYGMVVSTRPTLKDATLVVQSKEKSFECALPEVAFSQYNNLITLDFDHESVTAGQPQFRIILLVAMRVIFTLLIEGLVFFAFSYRKKASWIVFLIVNLITQGALNMALSGPNFGSYWIIGYIFFEIIIFITEMLVFAFILKEHRKSRGIVYALAANYASLIIGGVMISYLPV